MCYLDQADTGRRRMYLCPTNYKKTAEKMKKRKPAEITPTVPNLSTLLSPLEGTVRASLSPQRLTKIRKLEETMQQLERELNAFECVECKGAYPEHGQQGIACSDCEWKSCQWCIDMCGGRCPVCEFKESSDDDGPEGTRREQSSDGSDTEDY